MIYTTEFYRKRIDNIEYASHAVKSCFRKQHIRNYIPGQAIYNLGEYPNKMTIRPTEYDYNLIKQLAENGVGLIQIHEEWNDALRVMGADKYSSHDKEGLKEFIKLCHSFGIKILPYLSSGFFDERDPDYNPKFVVHPNAKLYQNYYRYRLGNAGSPEWNKFLFDNVRRVLDEYEFDGIFNDMGYDGFDNKGNPYAYGEYDPFIEDLLVRLYTVVKNEYHGTVKLHIGKTQFPVTDEKIYDYLWVGESCKTSEELMGNGQMQPVCRSVSRLQVHGRDQRRYLFCACTAVFAVSVTLRRPADHRRTQLCARHRLFGRRREPAFPENARILPKAPERPICLQRVVADSGR